MKDEQNQFYTSISKYYSEIFPYNPMQLQFVRNIVGKLNGKQMGAESMLLSNDDIIEVATTQLKFKIDK